MAQKREGARPAPRQPKEISHRAPPSPGTDLREAEKTLYILCAVCYTRGGKSFGTPAGGRNGSGLHDFRYNLTK